jgi:hypothetical protein
MLVKDDTPESPGETDQDNLLQRIGRGLKARQWAYIDHDARVAARLLVDQLAFSGTSLEHLEGPPSRDL